jgi:teichoic acid transport system permease protein
VTPSGHLANALLDIGVPLPVGEYLRRLWARRDFILTVPFGNLRVQTQSTVIGAGWHLLNPLLSATVYYVIFGVLLGARSGIENYPAFLVIGVFTFVYTSRTIDAGAGSITGNLGLITQINFPRLALPIAATATETLSHALALVALVAMVPALGIGPSVTWLLVGPVLALQALFNLGLAMIVARLVFQFRDIRKLLPHVIRFWMYLSGLFFTVDSVVDAVGADSLWVQVFQANPGYIFMTLMRDSLMQEEQATIWTWVTAAVWSCGLVVVGFLFFRRKEVEYGLG